MAKKDTLKPEVVWDKVSFSAKHEKMACSLAVNSNGRITLNDETLQALNYAQYIVFYYSPSHNLVAMKAADKNDSDAVRVGVKPPEKGKDASFVNKSVHQWLLELLKKEEGSISLTGEADEDKVVFNLKKATHKPKQIRRSNKEG